MNIPKLITSAPFDKDIAPGKNSKNYKRTPMSIPDSRVGRITSYKNCFNLFYLSVVVYWWSTLLLFLDMSNLE